jgi:hypothetical protein
MKLATYEDLLAIQRECVSQGGDFEAVLRWVDSVGIERDALAEYSKTVGEETQAAAHLARSAGFAADEFLTAVFMAGMEFGVRYQQSREVIV